MSADHRSCDATSLVQAFASGETNPLEVMQATLERMDLLNPTLNAIVHPRPEQALTEAAAATKRWNRRRKLGEAAHVERLGSLDAALDGVPTAIKDLGCEQAGEPYHAGARFLVEMDWRGSLDSHLYKLLRQAGLISVGRTNTPEFGTTITTEPQVYGPTANPWDVTRSPGGSSGGSAAAVAAGIVPLAHGNDGGGSIRVPAAACGLVGLKPSRGRVSVAPRLGEHRAGLAVDGMLTRTVRDAARCLDVIGRPARGDPYIAPPLAPGTSFTDVVASPPPPLRIALTTGRRGAATEPVRHAVELTAQLLAELGHIIEPDSTPDGWYSPEVIDHTIVVRTVAMSAELALWSQRLERPITEVDVEPANWWSAELGRSLPASAYVQSLDELARWRRRVMAFWNTSAVGKARAASEGTAVHETRPLQQGRFDILLSPVLADVTPPLGYLSDPIDGARRVAEMAAFVNQANLSGQPAISLPTALDPNGIPLGVQLHAAHGDESLLLAVAQQLADAGGLTPLRDLPRQPQ